MKKHFFHRWAEVRADRPAWPASRGRGKRTVHYECKIPGCTATKTKRKSVRR